MLGVVLRCRRRSKSTGTRSQYASMFGVHRSRRVARRCNPTHAYCCGMSDDVVLRCRRRSKSTGTRSQYASMFGVPRSRRVARRCNPTHACCCGMSDEVIQDDCVKKVTYVIGHLCDQAAGQGRTAILWIN